LLEQIFAAKDVPISLMRDVQHTREFHRPDWPDVELSVAGGVRGFDYYFDFVVGLIAGLETLREE